MRVERFGPGGLRHLQPGAEHQLDEVAVLLDTPQDRTDLADHQLEHGDLLLEQMQHLLLQRAAGHQIEHEDLALLADAVDTADALLDRHRIPRHVEIDERVAELDVAPLAAGLGAQQHRHAVAEVGDGGILVGAAEAALEAARMPCPPAPADRRGERASRGNGRRPVSSPPDCAAAGRAAPASLPPVPNAAHRSASARQRRLVGMARGKTRAPPPRRRRGDDPAAPSR